MKLLAVHSVLPESKRATGVDIWRIWSPLQELKKNTDWEIDEQPTLIKDIAEYKNEREFSEAEMEKAATHLGQYDVIWTAYFSNPTFYALLRVVQARYGTKFVLDVDDDLFSIKLDNPIWLKLTDENVYHMQCMIRDADFLTTTTEELASVLRERRKQPKESVFVIPNAIRDDYKEYDPDNGDKIKIGYFGGSSHINDVHATNLLPALERIMHENKNVIVETCGMPIEAYLPKARYSYNEGGEGLDWATKVFPKLNYDIALGPLEVCPFADGKSNIKWQESTRMGAAFVASNTGPYKSLKNGVNAYLVENTEEDWYKAIKKLVDSPKQRRIIVENARNDLRTQTLKFRWRIAERALLAVHNS